MIVLKYFNYNDNNDNIKLDESGKLPLEPTRFNQGQTRFRRQGRKK